jgi:hypothetical protein
MIHISMEGLFRWSLVTSTRLGIRCIKLFGEINTFVYHNHQCEGICLAYPPSIGNPYTYNNILFILEINQ